jgi:hypothetical protein
MNIMRAGELQNVFLQELHTAVEAQHVFQVTQSMFQYLISKFVSLGLTSIQAGIHPTWTRMTFAIKHESQGIEYGMAGNNQGKLVRTSTAIGG